MGLKDDLDKEVADIYKEQWSRRDGQKIPEDTEIKLGNDGVDLEATILYADLADSTKLVDNYKDWYAGEQYKTFLRCATKLIKSEGGEVRSYDGDRVMGIFIGDSKNTNAVRCGLKINWAVKNIIEPAKKKQYPSTNYVMKHVCGIDNSKVLAARAGIRGSNDLVWIGKAANYAAKLSAMSETHATWITCRVYDNMNKDVKYSNDKNMWEEMKWSAMNDLRIYRSTYWWSFT
ncbi:adenylate/guanylate cyclase domain-containing protein [Mesorhizobium sp. M1156]|uniref:adenylate/guanylate cyclase domain-containing protein n=1 Tax=unclassified Mesorhizobium TaxID=325217 RepID=UPI00333C933C